MWYCSDLFTWHIRQPSRQNPSSSEVQENVSFPHYIQLYSALTPVLLSAVPCQHTSNSLRSTVKETRLDARTQTYCFLSLLLISPSLKQKAQCCAPLSTENTFSGSIIHKIYCSSKDFSSLMLNPTGLDWNLSIQLQPEMIRVPPVQCQLLKETYMDNNSQYFFTINSLPNRLSSTIQPDAFNNGQTQPSVRMQH